MSNEFTEYDNYEKTALTSIQLYINDIVDIPLITQEEKDSHIYTRAQNGDKEAYKRCVEGNLKLVMSIAKKFNNNDFLEYVDLIQEGNLGLMKAIDKYDESSGNQFSTYATWWIRQTILRALANKGRDIRLPVHIGEKLNRVQRATIKLAETLERNPTIDEISEEVGLDNEQVKYLLQVGQRTLPLNMLLGDSGDDEFTLEDTLSSPDDVFEAIMKELMVENVKDAMNNLTERERNVISMRYGLNGYSSMTLSEVGSIYGLSRERIRQIESKAISKLRKDKMIRTYEYDFS